METEGHRSGLRGLLVMFQSQGERVEFFFGCSLSAWGPCCGELGGSPRWGFVSQSRVAVPRVWELMGSALEQALGRSSLHSSTRASWWGSESCRCWRQLWAVRVHCLSQRGLLVPLLPCSCIFCRKFAFRIIATQVITSPSF